MKCMCVHIHPYIVSSTVNWLGLGLRLVFNMALEQHTPLSKEKDEIVKLVM